MTFARDNDTPKRRMMAKADIGSGEVGMHIFEQHEHRFIDCITTLRGAPGCVRPARTFQASGCWWDEHIQAPCLTAAMAAQVFLEVILPLPLNQMPAYPKC